MPRFLPLIALLLAFVTATAQQKQKPTGRFLEDSVRIGDTIRFALSYRHKPEEEVLFPDTTATVGDFELLSKRYFPTITRHGQSLDSTVYLVRTFELKPVYHFSLPVYLLKNGDSTILQSTYDSVFMVEMVKQLPEKVQLAENVALVPLKQEFDYPKLILWASVALAMVLLLVLLFRRPLRRLYNRYMAQTGFRAFISRFDALHRRFRRNQTVQLLEEAVTLWKNYLTEIEDRPINSFTTKEIAEYYNDEELSEALKQFDKAIYGGIIETEQDKTTVYLQLLKDFSVVRYNQLQNKPADVERIAT